MRHPLYSICPYFTMFPETFVQSHVDEFTEPGDLVFDPFSGRGTTVFQSKLMERPAIGMDTNPVAFCVSSAKADPPPLRGVLTALNRFETSFVASDTDALREERMRLHAFFRRAFYHYTLDQILFLRHELDWRGNRVHRFIAALALGSLHGEMDKSSAYFSNQMPRTISTKPAYSLGYWRKHGLWPKKRRVFEMLKDKARFRLQLAAPDVRGRVLLGDVRSASKKFRRIRRMVKLVVTSPPYFDVTRCEEDQWLRLWFLGGSPRPTYGQVSPDDRHSNLDSYWRFLSEAWEGIEPMMAPGGVIACRMGGRGLTPDVMTEPFLDSMGVAFPKARLLREPLTSRARNRTPSFRPSSAGGRVESDYVVQV